MDAKRTVFSLLSSAGLGQRSLQLYDAVASWPDIPDVDPAIREYEIPAAERKGSVLIPVVAGLGNPYFHCLVGHAFRVRGYEPLMLFCESDLPLCFRKEAPKDEVSCDECRYYGQKTLDAFGIEPVPIDDHVGGEYQAAMPDPPEPGREVTYKGIPISEYAMASARKFLKQYHLDEDDEWDRAVYRSFLQSGAILAEATDSVLSEYDVTATIGANGAYVYGGVPMALSEHRDVTTYCFSMGKSDQKIMVGGDKTRLPLFTDPEEVERRLGRDLSPGQREEIDAMMEGRADGSTARVQWSGDSSERIDVRESERVVSLFTNLMWDASLEVEHRSAFEGPYEWVRASIEHFDAQDEDTLVIKPHPAEVVRGTNEGMAQWIRDEFEELSDSVEVLDPDTEIGPYGLLNGSDVALVWNSTIGLEAAYRGVPTVVAGVAHYRDFGFTYDPDTPQRYREMLDRDSLEMDEQMRARARRYAYLFFVAKQLDFPFYRSAQTSREYLPVRQEQFTAGNETFDRLVDGVVNEKPVLYDQ